MREPIEYSDAIYDLLQAGPPDEPMMVINMPHDVYHTLKSYISASRLKHMKETPYHYFQYGKDPKQAEKDQAPGLVFGSAAHDYFENPESFLDKHITIDLSKRPMPDNNMNKGENKQWRNDILANAAAEGKRVVTADDYEKIKRFMESIKSYEESKYLLEEGWAEVAFFWVDEETGLPCKIKVDWLSSDIVPIDYKTMDKVGEWDVKRQIRNMSYDVGVGQYCEGLSVYLGEDVDRYMFLCLAKQWPNCAAMYALPPDYIEAQRDQWRMLMGKVRRCMDRNEWPGYEEYAAEGTNILTLDFTNNY